MVHLWGRRDRVRPQDDYSSYRRIGVRRKMFPRGLRRSNKVTEGKVRKESLLSPREV